MLPCNVHERINKKGIKYYALVRLGKDNNGKEVRKSTKARNTIEEAWEDAYILKKEAVCERAEKYKNYLPKEVYLTLLRYEPKKY
jgi:hypothetical protein